MRHYYVLNQDPQSARVFEFIQAHKLDHTVHINRTRFWVPEPSIILTECMLRFSNCVHLVDPNLDLATGLPKEYPSGY